MYDIKQFYSAQQLLRLIFFTDHLVDRRPATRRSARKTAVKLQCILPAMLWSCRYSGNILRMVESTLAAVTDPEFRPEFRIARYYCDKVPPGIRTPATGSKHRLTPASVSAPKRLLFAVCVFP